MLGPDEEGDRLVMYRLHVLNLKTRERRYIDFDCLQARICAAIALNAQRHLVLTTEDL